MERFADGGVGGGGSNPLDGEFGGWGAISCLISVTH